MVDSWRVVPSLAVIFWAVWYASSEPKSLDKRHEFGHEMVHRPQYEDVYIVRFREYRMAQDHKSVLEAALTTVGWQWIERHNPAMRFPTDFGLIKAPRSSIDEIASFLKRFETVKDVYQERRLSHRLTSLASGDVETIFKPPGRLQTRPTFSLEGNVHESKLQASQRGTFPNRILAQQQPQKLATLLGADKLWSLGFRGQGVRMGVFDTGIIANHPDVKNITERTNWTHEPTLDDGLGHGSFVAGVIAGTSPDCPGLAPDVAIYTFRVFTNDQVSYTSWFLDAFNYAIATEMDVVNLSIGGPDYLDRPFVEKVWEVTGAGIIMTSAIGNDGPLYGTLNNPADQNDVIGVGGIGWGGEIAQFSSRGMSTWELPRGYGRSKPDVMAHGKDVQGSRITGGCRSLSGTSVASPVVAGAVCLLASTVPLSRRHMLNPGSMKQVLIEGASRLPSLNMFEQGAGALNVTASHEILTTYSPRASIVPAKLDLTECPYAWPFCRQPLYADAMPVMFNATILNGMGVVGQLEGSPEWKPADQGGEYLDVQFEWSPVLWPWSGYLAVYLRVRSEGSTFHGTAQGEVSFTVLSPPSSSSLTEGETSGPQRTEISLPIKAEIIPTPTREKRILWDQFHSMAYPPAYIPRDDLAIRHDILDWHGDHIHTNFHELYNFLKDSGYYIEVLGSPATCFDASSYGILMIVDPEEEFYKEEITKLRSDVEKYGLGLVVFADWYELGSVKNTRFYDDNTRSWWEAATGGSNVPALNDLLMPMGVAFAGGTYDLQMGVKGVDGNWQLSSGSSLAAFPAGGYLFYATSDGSHQPDKPDAPPVLGLTDVGRGRLVVYGDSNCLDEAHRRGGNCHDLLLKLLAYTTHVDENDQETGTISLTGLLTETARLEAPFGSLEVDGLPQRRTDVDMSHAFYALNHPLECFLNSNKAVMPRSKSAVQSKAEPERRGDGKDWLERASKSQQNTAVLDAHRDVENKSELTENVVMSDSMELPSASNTPLRWVPEKMVGNVQIISVLGTVGLFLLWSLTRRRIRPVISLNGGYSSAGKRIPMLPVFNLSPVRPSRHE